MAKDRAPASGGHTTRRRVISMGDETWGPISTLAAERGMRSASELIRTIAEREVQQARENGELAA